MKRANTIILMRKRDSAPRGPCHSQFVKRCWSFDAVEKWSGDNRNLMDSTFQFIAKHDWPLVQAECHELARHARQAIGEVMGLDPITPEVSGLRR
jgi:hypothetical protein